jgi:diadenosine tetraphosphate (Ap4A) HIT family hydrolase
VGNLIEERVEAARAGENPYVIVRMRSGWLVIGDVQPLPGYCLLLADPVVESPNALCEADRIQYSLDVLRVGDALLRVTGAYRINYMTLANLEPSLHTHIIPRFWDEPEEKRRAGAFQAYDWASARPFDPQADGPFVEAMRACLSPSADSA